MTWLWIIVIVLGAAIACGALYVIEKRKKIFKKRTKEEKAAAKAKKAAKKEAKLAKKQNLPPKEEEKPKEELSLSEKKIKQPEPAATFEAEPYSPEGAFNGSMASSAFEGRPGFAGMNGQMTDMQRRQMMEQRMRQMQQRGRMPGAPRRPSFSSRESVREQIDNLSPEMKVLLLTGALERKEDDEF